MSEQPADGAASAATAAGGQPGEGGAPEPPKPNLQHQAASKRIQQTQAQVDEVVGIMRVNVEKVLERDQKLSELDDRAGCSRDHLVVYNASLTPEHLQVVDLMRDNLEKVMERDVKLTEMDERADALQQGASQFEQQAGKLKRKYWWKNCKMWAIIIAVVVIILIVIIVYASSS